MAYIRKRGSTYRAEVSKHGVDRSASFPTKAQAVAWATALEAEINAGRTGAVVPGKTLAMAMNRYALEESPKKRGERWEGLRIKAFLKEAHAAYKLSLMPLQAIKGTHIAAWRDERRKQVSAGSVLREWNLLSAVFSKATEWAWISRNPMTNVKRLDPVKPRHRIFADAEIAAILDVSSYLQGHYPATKSQLSAAAFLFALETAMRAGEICYLQKSDIHLERKIALVRMSKNGEAREVPLSQKAISILSQLDTDPLFHLTPSQLDANFRKLKKAAGITGATFHDSRATALTRLAPRFQAHELAKISGHKNLNILLNTYYRVDVSSLAERLD